MEDGLEQRSLRGVLELEPLLHVIPLWEGGEGYSLVGVIFVEDVVHDGGGLPQLAAA